MNIIVFRVVLLVLGGLTPFPTSADVFCDNLKQVAATLPKNTSSSPVHFATATLGQAPDVVYALALCIGYVHNDSTCGECVAKTFGQILNATPPEQQQCYKSAFYFGAGPCTVIFSGDDILLPLNASAEQNDGWSLDLWNPKNFTGDAGDVRLIVGLKQELLLETVQRAAATEPERYATGVADSGTTFPPVYSMVQCTPDLPARDCLTCLQVIDA